MRNEIRQLLCESVNRLTDRGILPTGLDIDVHLERTRNKTHGDFASNVALALAKRAGTAPRELAQQIIDLMPAAEMLEKVEIAGPGFINVFLKSTAYFRLIDDIRRASERYGRSLDGTGRRVMIEFVSANPTGPLHVGHGRGAAYGDSLSRVLRAAGYEACSEYYINDAGRQMDILALSVWLRYLELCGEAFEFPDNCYQGDYIFDIAATVHRQHAERFRHGPVQLLEQASIEDGEERLDDLIAGSKARLGEEGYEVFYRAARDTLVDDIRTDLTQFGVTYDQWFSERSLVEDGAVERAVERLRENGHLYQESGAWWFRSTAFGDEKDRVVIRANGQHTYFATDIAYHLNKVERGFQTLINIWGADHHGYIARVKASLDAAGIDSDRLTVLLVQFATLYRGGEKMSMSTRGGEFVTLRELRQEVGNDAARFFYALRKPEQHMDFDLDLAKSQSNDNPVYYVQYAHARICSVFRLLAEKGIDVDLDSDPPYHLLIEAQEMDLLRELSRYPEVVTAAANSYEPHQVAYYLRELANQFHTYYNAHPFIATEQDLRLARLGLIDATRQVIANGLNLLGVSAPESM